MPGRAKTKLQRLRAAPSVSSVHDFKYQIRQFERPSIVAEGDSWFEYPRTWNQKPGNIIDHIQRWTKGKVNLLRLGASGDEATEMLSRKQRHRMTKLLDETAKSTRPVDLLLFSAGGNDLLGDWDLVRFVLPYRAGVPMERLFHKARLNQKLKQVELAHRELLTIRNHYSAKTIIVTHTYDRAIPSNVGVRFLGKNIAGPWIKPALDDAGFPEGAIQRKAARHLLERLSTTLRSLESSSEARGRFFVAHTHGLVKDNEWRNEIHPTPRGFKRVAENRKWMQSSDIRLAVVKSPKTPTPIAIKHLATLRTSELRVLAKMGNAREVLRREALKLYLQRTGGMGRGM